MIITEGIKFSIDKISKKESFQLAKIGSTPLLSPVTSAIIFYCKLCGIPKLETRNDVEELWFRIIYLRRLGFCIYTSGDVFETHHFEPFYNDIYEHMLLEVETSYVPRKQWINKMIDIVIKQTTTMADNGKNKYPLKELLDLRESSLPDYIKQETNIDVTALQKLPEPAAEETAKNVQKPADKAPDKKPELNDDGSVQNPHPVGSPEWHIHEHQIKQMKEAALKTINPQKTETQTEPVSDKKPNGSNTKKQVTKKPSQSKNGKAKSKNKKK